MFEKKADSVYRHRGKIVSRKTASPDKFIWQLKENIDKTKSRWTSSKTHPYVRLVNEKLFRKKSDINRLLTLIEKTLPVESIQIQQSKDQMESVIIDYHEAKRIFEEALTVMTSIGQSKSKAIEDLTFYEPFIHHKEQLLKDFT